MIILVRKILLLHLLIFSSYANEFNLTLKEFSEMVAVQNNINILIADDIDQNKILFIIANTKNVIDLLQFKNMLIAKNLLLIDYNDFYFIDKKDKTPLQIEREQKITNRYFKIKHLSYEDIETILEPYKLDFVYLNNKVMVTCDSNMHLRLIDLFKQFDIKKKGCSYFEFKEEIKEDGTKHQIYNWIDNCPKIDKNKTDKNKKKDLKNKSNKKDKNLDRNNPKIEKNNNSSRDKRDSKSKNSSSRNKDNSFTTTVPVDGAEIVEAPPNILIK
jgi:hypothetical protein